MDDPKNITIKHTLSGFVLFQLLINRRQRPSIACHGFSLVELLFVIAIIGALASMALPSFNEFKTNAKNKACASDLRTIDNAIAAYSISNNALPASLNDIGMGTLVDPWGRSYVYQSLSDAAAVPLEDNIVGSQLNTDYDLYSKGSDGASTPASGDPTNTDDIVRSNNGAYVGMRP